LACSPGVSTIAAAAAAEDEDVVFCADRLVELPRVLVLVPVLVLPWLPPLLLPLRLLLPRSSSLPQDETDLLAVRCIGGGGEPPCVCACASACTLKGSNGSGCGSTRRA